VRCTRNLKTRGSSARTVTVNKAARDYLLANKAGLNTALGRRLDANTTSVAKFFGSPYPQLNPLPSSLPATYFNQSKIANLQSTKSYDDVFNQSHNLPTIRDVIDKRLKAFKNEDPQYSWLSNCKYPTALTCAIGYIASVFEHRKPAKTQDPLPAILPMLRL
jgi:hypothetical protein